MFFRRTMLGMSREPDFQVRTDNAEPRVCNANLAF
jgi:hypothetical protein